MEFNGYVEFLVYSPTACGWLGLGWIDHSWEDSDQKADALLDFEEGLSHGPFIGCVFPRPALSKLGTGIVFYIESDYESQDQIRSILITTDKTFRLIPTDDLESITEGAAISKIRDLIVASARSERKAIILKNIKRPVFTGVETLSKVWPEVLIEIDTLYICPPDGLLLRGWFFDPHNNIAEVSVRCGPYLARIDLQDCVRIRRSDVKESLRSRYGDIDERCGFMGLARNISLRSEPAYLEIKTLDGDVAFKPLGLIRVPGIDAIKDILSHHELRYNDLSRGFDQVIGPAVELIGSSYLQRSRNFSRVEFGGQIKDPVCSIIIPLHGRLDFMEYQLSDFSLQDCSGLEIIYVLDDPTRRRECEFMAASCWERFRVPLNLVVLDNNLGYGPANNIGLGLARGEYICFLNSDVFPKMRNWLNFLLETARKDGVGIVGALLLFEDETIQHDGCSFEPIPEFSGWIFCMHPGKGRATTEGADVHQVEAATGACLVASRTLLTTLGGFDEAFIIGDFEDTDLCLRVKRLGLTCVVDRRAKLYHLERQSQGGGNVPWRTNLTLYNAWQFYRRWFMSSAIRSVNNEG